MGFGVSKLLSSFASKAFETSVMCRVAAMHDPALLTRLSLGSEAAGSIGFSLDLNRSRNTNLAIN